MRTRKIIVIDQEADTNLGTICNTALKNVGIEVFQDVTAIISAVTEEWSDEPDFFCDKDKE